MTPALDDFGWILGGFPSEMAFGGCDDTRFGRFLGVAGHIVCLIPSLALRERTQAELSTIVVSLLCSRTFI